MFVKRSASAMGLTMLNSGTTSSPLTPKVERCRDSHKMKSSVRSFSKRPSVLQSLLASSQ